MKQLLENERVMGFAVIVLFWVSSTLLLLL